MKNLLTYLILLIVATGCGNDVVSQHKQDPSLFIDLSSDLVILQQYTITKNKEALKIDGLANEPAWQRALFSEPFIDIEGIIIPKFETKIKMLWDENYLYIYAEMLGPHIWGDLKKRDTVIFFNNDFEVFLSPSGTTRNYGEIEINALGTVWDLLLDKPYRDGGNPNNNWNLDGLKSAVHIEGTLNNHKDIDSLWTVEMAIPMNALLELKNKSKNLPEEGEQWRINFSRVEWDFDILDGIYQRKKLADGKFQPAYNWVWSNQNVISMHQPEKWGVVQFTNETSLENVKFITDESMPLQQVAYALFRQTKRGSLKYLLDEEVGSIKTMNVKYGDNKELEASFYRTNFGFEYKINSFDSDQVLIIKESGVLKIE